MKLHPDAILPHPKFGGQTSSNTSDDVKASARANSITISRRITDQYSFKHSQLAHVAELRRKIYRANGNDDSNQPADVPSVTII